MIGAPEGETLIQATVDKIVRLVRSGDLLENIAIIIRGWDAHAKLLRSALLSAGLTSTEEVLYTAGFTVACSLALLLPFLAVVIGRHQVVPLLEKGKQLLFSNGDVLVGGLSLVLAGYLGWQGIEGLQLG